MQKHHEAWLNAILLVCHALTVDDSHKEAFVAAGVTDAVMQIFSEGCAGGNQSCLSWETKSNLTLVAQLAVVVPGKAAMVAHNKSLSTALRGADSVMLQTAVIQTLLNVVEHPKARALFLELGVEADVREVMLETNDEFVKRVANSFIELLNWKP